MEESVMKEKKYYSFETMFRSLKDELRGFLKKSGIYYELSDCYGGWHFQILLDRKEYKLVQDFIDSETITERRN
jgi:hypothetical protein